MGFLVCSWEKVCVHLRPMLGGGGGLDCTWREGGRELMRGPPTPW